MIDPLLMSSITGLVGMIVGYIAKSKCTNFSCCYGLLDIKRDINCEVEIEVLKTNRSNVWKEYENNKNY
jgi:hypothetical protein